IGLDRLVRAGDRARQRAAERELHVTPVDAGIGERAAHRARAELETGDALEPAERVDADAGDGDAHDTACAGANANMRTSVPSGSVRNGSTTSSISMPISRRAGSGSVSRVSTITSSGSST